MDEYLEMLNLEDKYTRHLTVWEVVQAFPDCRDVAMRVAYDCQEYLSQFDTSDILVAEFIKSFHEYKLLQDTNKFLKLTKPTIDRKELDIEKAKSVPIQSLYDFTKVRKSRTRIQASCPFHLERIPSLFVFTDQNSFHCFSCKRGGSAIDFIMELYGINFVEAVKKLNGVTL